MWEVITFRYGLDILVLILCPFVPILYWQLKNDALTLLMSLQVNIPEPPINLQLLRRIFCFSVYSSFFVLLMTSSCQVVSFELKDYSLSSQFASWFQLFHYCISIIDQSVDIMIANSPWEHLFKGVLGVCLFTPSCNLKQIFLSVLGSEQAIQLPWLKKLSPVS